MTNELWRMGATDLAAAIRRKDVKSREVVEAHLGRIAAVNAKVNAVTVVLADEALAAADAADRALAAGAAVGALHGVPISVKENIDVAGQATTQGVVSMVNAVAPVDAPQLRQLRAAGAIPFARTNLPDFGLRWHSDNGLRGATLNPWDRGRTPGGSSGGEAAALASGMTPLGLGNDYGGSLRWPSQCCGTAALKPTLGRIPDHSSINPAEAPITVQLMAVEGPMARHVRDLRLAFEAMSGPDTRDPWWAPAPFRGPAVPRRVAFTVDPGGEGVEPAVAAGVRRAAAALRDAGYEVVEVEPPRVAAARDLWASLVVGELREVFAPLLADVACADANRFLGLALDVVPPLTLQTYMAGLAERNALAREWAQFFERYPVLLGPVCAMGPFPAGYDLSGTEAVSALLRAMRLVVTCNLLGLPAVALPVGVQDGLPQGVEVIGGRYREDLCLDAAEAIENRLGVITPIDPR